MLKNIRLQNFKSFSSLSEIESRRITLLYGPNSAGKSSIIQSLMMLKQTLSTYQGPLSRPSANADLVTQGEYIDLGSFRSVVSAHSEQKTLTFHIDSSSSTHGPLRNGVNQNIQLFYGKEKLKSFQVQYGKLPSNYLRFLSSGSRKALNPDDSIIEEITGRPTGSYSIDKRIIKGLAREIRSGAFLKSVSEFIDHSYFGFNLKNLSFDELSFGEEEIEKALSSVRVKFVSRASFYGSNHFKKPDILSKIQILLETIVYAAVIETSRSLAAISYIGPLRSYPQRFYLYSGKSSLSVGQTGENMPYVLFENQRGVQSEINKWFGDFDVPYILSVGKHTNEVSGNLIVLSLRDKASGVEVSPKDVGFGIGQIMPILTEGIVSRNRTICVEQPELHLHPRLQAHLGDFFIRTSGPLKSDNQRSPIGGENRWIIETHSETLMLRLQRRIREGAISSKDVAVYYVDKGKDGWSFVIPLRMDKKGNFIDAWPDGFFEEGYRDIFHKTTDKDKDSENVSDNFY